MKKVVISLFIVCIALGLVGSSFADQAPTIMPLLYTESEPVPVLISAPPTPELISEPTPELISAPTYTWSYGINDFLATLNPFKDDQDLYLPLRETAENLGFTVEWSASDKAIHIQKDAYTAKLALESKMFSKNKALGQFTHLPKLVDGRTFLSVSDLEAVLSMHAWVKDTSVIWNTHAVNHITMAPQVITEWVEATKTSVGSHIKVVDGVSYILIVEEEKSTGGYTFDFSRIYLNDDVLTLKYDVVAPDGMAIQVLTKPHTLLKVDGLVTQVVKDAYNFRGTIIDLKYDEHGVTVYLDGGTPNDMLDDLVANIHFETLVANGSLKDFKIGAVLDIKYEISTRSIPPQTNAMGVRLVSTPDLYSVYTGQLKTLEESETTYTLHLSKDNDMMNDLIVHIKKDSLMASEVYELEGKNITVEYAIMTMSIPPQTNPIKIQVAR